MKIPGVGYRTFIHQSHRAYPGNLSKIYRENGRIKSTRLSFMWDSMLLGCFWSEIAHFGTRYAKCIISGTEH